MKKISLNNKIRILALALAIIGTATLALSYYGQKNVTVALTRLTPIYRVERSDELVAISFDAAWGSDKTLKILDILDKYKVKATFFLVGFWIDAYPALVREIALRGHEIGSHSMTHPQMSKLTTEKMTYEIQESCNKITALTGNAVRVFRPPFGDYNNNLIEVCENLNVKAIQWDVDSLDWKGLSASEIVARVGKAKSGSIVLFHNNSDNIVQALPLVIFALQNKGLTLATMSEIIYNDNYYIDSSGCQRKNSNNN